ncbi:hypothetical protein AURDEDRAFT_158612, partial [Auricularia subglabra TFB-10046 SS5]
MTSYAAPASVLSYLPLRKCDISRTWRVTGPFCASSPPLLPVADPHLQLIASTPTAHIKEQEAPSARRGGTHNRSQGDRNQRHSRDKALEEEIHTLLSDENIAEWAKEYRLRERLRFGPEVAASVDKSAELAALFKAYAGAVDRELGPAVLTKWIEDLINAPPPTEAQPPPTAPPPGPPVKAGAFSARLNEMSQLHKHKLDFKAESAGPSHNLTWTMHVF